MTVAAKNHESRNKSVIESAGVARAPRSFLAQLFAYLVEWRRREARRTIGRYDHLVARHRHRFAAPDTEPTRQGATPAADHVDVMRSAAILRDFA